ncbi:Hypothetical protein NTJ_02868 [Nesidiocoris tenuis]|uniref:Uncharacterized protein n=1 Tax=Nesidiocoris tenuis TaxID=355587 RepID=A0ABN7AGR4_9HEMI|nr:Hypothetical protein NTJ_02868 [Nesidiocoris tenuis]
MALPPRCAVAIVRRSCACGYGNGAGGSDSWPPADPAGSRQRVRTIRSRANQPHPRLIPAERLSTGPRPLVGRLIRRPCARCLRRSIIIRLLVHKDGPFCAGPDDDPSLRFRPFFPPLRLPPGDQTRSPHRRCGVPTTSDRSAARPLNRRGGLRS